MDLDEDYGLYLFSVDDENNVYYMKEMMETD